MVATVAMSLVMVACAAKNTPSQNANVGSAKSGIVALELLSRGINTPKRPAALVGIYITHFLEQGTFPLVKGALMGVQADTAFAKDTEEDQNEDYRLLQAFSDALQVNIADLLNKSPDRDESLKRYTEALVNVSERAKSRVAELETTLKSYKEEERAMRSDLSKLRRQASSAMKDNNFSEAGAAQKMITEKEQELSAKESEINTTDDIHDHLQDLLDIYGERIVAIELNREALLSGIKVIDVPGAKEIDVLEQKRLKNRGSDVTPSLNDLMNINSLVK